MLLGIAACVGLTGCFFGEDEKKQKMLHGRKLYKQECSSCHEIKQPRNRSGPHMLNIVGRKAGTVATFPEYSPALQRAEFKWTEERLVAFMQDPQGMIPGTSMAYSGLSSEEAAQDLVTYLKNPRAAEKAYQEKHGGEGSGDGDGGGEGDGGDH